MTTDTLFGFRMLGVALLFSIILGLFCWIMAVLEELKAQKSRKGIFNEKKGDG